MFITAEEYDQLQFYIVNDCITTELLWQFPRICAMKLALSGEFIGLYTIFWIFLDEIDDEN